MLIDTTDSKNLAMGMQFFYNKFEQLEYAGAIPAPMWDSIVDAATEMIDVLESQIHAVANTLAAAHAGKFGLDDDNTAQTSWCIAYLADTIRGMKSVIDHDRCKKTSAELYEIIAAEYRASPASQPPEGSTANNVHSIVTDSKERPCT